MSTPFLNALFNPSELVCATDTPFGKDSCNYWAAPTDVQFVAVNPMIEDNKRSDDNVAVFRNFLIEMDEGSLPDQAYYIEKELGMPFTTKTYSGGKSYHYVISLETPCLSIDEYRRTAAWLLAIATKADPKCRNPSRLTRMAGAMRPDGTRQTLVQVNRRVTNRELGEYFERHIAKIEAYEAEQMRLASIVEGTALEDSDLPPEFRGELSKRTKMFLAEGAGPGERNAGLHFAACDFKNNCYPIEEALAQLAPAWRMMGKSNHELRTTVQSAYRKAPIRPRTAV